MRRPPSLVVYRTRESGIPFERVLLDGRDEDDVVGELSADPAVVRIVREDPPSDGYGLEPTATWEREHGKLRRREFRTGQLMVPVDREVLSAVCREHGIVRLAVFGSAITDDFDPVSSDVDVLVEFDPERGRSLLDVAAAQAGLSAAFGDREVDLAEFKQARESILIRHVVESAVEIFRDEKVSI